MVTTLKFTIHAEVTDKAEYGTAIVVPSRESWYVDPVTVLTKTMVADLRLLYQTAAVEKGRMLHHAECVLTNDPAELEQMLVRHDCEDCRAGAARARTFLAENPGREIVIAWLYWMKL